MDEIKKDNHEQDMSEEQRLFEESIEVEADYGGAQIQALDGLEHVRLRPGMYIGTTGLDGLHHLVYEVTDNSIDEAMAGFCKEITIELEDGEFGEVCSVTDDGRGIPVDIQPQTGLSALEVCLTKLNAGGKFGDGAYKVSGGLHGVGVSCVNALSTWLQATVYRDGNIYQQTYHIGVPEGPVEIVGKCEEGKTGTKIAFTADFSVMMPNSFSYDVLAKRFRELSFLNKDLKITISDKRNGQDRTEVFHSKGGLSEYVVYMNGTTNTLSQPIAFSGIKDGVVAEVALQYNDKYDEKIYSFVNNINTREGGTHLTGFKTALLRSINLQLQKNAKMLKKFGGDRLESADICEGLTGVVSIKIANPQFEGQTKMKLGNSNVSGIVQTLVYENLNNHFDEFPADIEKILEKGISAALGRIAARKAREQIRKKSEGGGLPGKLADCSEKDPAKCEVFIVEGDSAGGSAKQGRDRTFQAILPLWGKMLNVEKAQEYKVLGNEKLMPVIATIGAGMTRYNNSIQDGEQTFDIEKARYHKVIIMADADVDGSHIRTLLLTFFFRYMRPLIEAGYVYFAMPPLYKLTFGKKVFYAYDEEQRRQIIRENANGMDESKIPTQRYKGLGEMNPDQLWETTMNPETRLISQIHLEDAEEADRIFTMLMGEEVEPRREFIEQNASYVANLDV